MPETSSHRSAPKATPPRGGWRQETFAAGRWNPLPHEFSKVYGPQLGAAGLALYVVLMNHANADGYARPGIRTLKRLTRLGDVTLAKSRADLVALGLIAVAVRPRGARGGNTFGYTLLPLPNVSNQRHQRLQSETSTSLTRDTRISTGTRAIEGEHEAAGPADGEAAPSPCSPSMPADGAGDVDEAPGVARKREDRRQGSAARVAVAALDLATLLDDPTVVAAVQARGATARQAGVLAEGWRTWWAENKAQARLPWDTWAARLGTWITKQHKLPEFEDEWGHRAPHWEPCVHCGYVTGLGQERLCGTCEHGLRALVPFLQAGCYGMTPEESKPVMDALECGLRLAAGRMANGGDRREHERFMAPLRAHARAVKAQHYAA